MTTPPLTQEQVERIVDGAPERHRRIMSDLHATPEHQAFKRALIAQHQNRFSTPKT